VISGLARLMEELINLIKTKNILFDIRSIQDIVALLKPVIYGLHKEQVSENLIPKMEKS